MLLKRALLTLAVIMLASPVWGGGLTVLAVKSKNLEPYNQALSGFRAEFQGRELNLVVIDEVERDTDLSSRIKGVNPDLILCLGSEALECACRIAGAPKLFCMVTSSGAADWAGKANVFGVTIDLPCKRQLEVLSSAFPKLKRIGLMYDPKLNQGLAARAETEARALELELVARPVQSIKDVPSALLELSGKIDLLWSIFDSVAYGPETARYVLLHTLKKDLPFVGFSAQHAKAGAIMAIYGDYEDMGRQLALIVPSILNHEKVAENIMQPRAIKIAVNRRVADSMGISFPPAFLRGVGEFY